MRASTSGKRVDCPRAPASRRSTYARALHTACLILGGVPHLADHLRVPSVVLREWLEGHSEPPQAAFLAAVEVILLHLEAPGRAS